MATIAVTSTTLNSKAETIKGISTNIQTLQSEIDQQIQTCKGIWTGEASDAFQVKYTAVSEKLKGIYDTIGEYAAFLEKAATAFAEAESKNVSSAEGLSS